MSEREMVSADEARAMGPQLAAAEATRLRDTVIALHAIIKGRTVAPTIAEARAHCHGPTRGVFVVTLGGERAHLAARIATGLQRFSEQPQRWVALDTKGRPCAWPEVSRG